MYRNGVFVGIQWDDIEKQHQRQWDNIEAYFGFSENPVSKPIDLSAETLWDIARSCVWDCRELLFSLIPLEYIQKNVFRYSDQADFSDLLRQSMQREMEASLCDHLVLSFAYRFFCENIESLQMKEYLDALYDFRDIPGRDWDDAAGARKDHHKSLKRMYQDFRTELGISDSEEVTENALMGKLSSTLRDVDSVMSFWKQLKEMKEDKLPPPSAWFVLSFVPEKIKFRNIMKNPHKDYLVALTELMQGAKYFQALLTEEAVDYARINLPNQYQERYMCFTGIPFENDVAKPLAITAREYKVKNHSTKIVIPARLQTVFNSYLFERNFHLHALTVAEYLLSKATTANRTAVYKESLLKVMKIHAPLIHSAWMSCLDGAPEMQRSSELVDRYVRRWNRQALPVVEELFIKRVKKLLPETESVVAAICKWIEQDLNYERLNIIRAVRPRKIVKTESDLKNMHNELLVNAFSVFENYDV